MKIKDLLKIIASPFVVFMIGYTIAAGTNLYDEVWWLNRLIHFLGGLSIAISGYLVFNLCIRAGYIKTSHIFFDALILVLTVMSVTVVWEFYEYLSDKYLFTHSQPSVEDVIKDQFMGMMGAVTFAFAWIAIRIFKKKRSQVEIEVEKIDLKITVE